MIIKNIIQAVTCGLVSIYLSSCSPEEDIESSVERNSITFNIGMENTGGLSTRSVSSIDFTRYKVKLYMYKQGTDASNLYMYTYLKEVDVERSVITVDVPEKPVNGEAQYTFVFMATPNDDEALLNLREYYFSFEDFETSFNGKDPVPGTTLLRDCYLPYFQQDGNTTVNVGPNNRDLFGYAYTVATAIDFHTPIEVVMTRQIGAVKLSLGKVTESTTVSCRVCTTRGRSYVSQMLYNTAGNLSGESGYTYYKYTRQVSSSDLDADGNCIMTFHYPYTTLKKMDESLTSDDMATSIEVKVGDNTYTLRNGFPIYRNRYTIFTQKDDNLLVSFGATGGIGIDGDDWDGLQ